MLSEPDWDGSEWAKTQAAVLAAQANRARIQAEYQAACGVHPATAARQASTFVTWSTLFWLFIGVPTFFITVGLWTTYVGVMVWKFAVMAMAYVLLVRLEAYKKHRADERLVYAIPTWVLATAGAVLMMSGPFVYLVSVAVQDAVIAAVTA